MNGHQDRSCGNVDGVGFGDFRRYSFARKIQEAKERLKEHGIEAVGWVGAIGFGIVTISRMMGV